MSQNEKYLAQCEPASEPQIRELETTIGFNLPHAYRTFLQTVNGFAIREKYSEPFRVPAYDKDFLLNQFYALSEENRFLNIYRKRDALLAGLPKWLLPIADWSGAEPKYLLDLRPEKSGAIYAQIIDDYPYNANPPFTPDEMWPDKAPEDVSEAHLEELETYWYICEDIDALLRLARVAL